MKIIVDEVIISALAHLVDDSKNTRFPSHAEIDFQIKRANLKDFDPHAAGPLVGKAKRVRGLLFNALESKPEEVEKFVLALLAAIKGAGGFKDSSPNYTGKESIENLSLAFKAHNLILDNDGTLSEGILENLSGKELTQALNNYAIRAKKGVEDGALLVGTGKDLIEAVIAHVIIEKFGNYDTKSNFQMSLEHAYIALELTTPKNKPIQGEHPRKQIERNIFDLACSINKLRNKQGTGHGRPWIPDLKSEEAKFVIESIGVIAEFLLNKLKKV